MVRFCNERGDNLSIEILGFRKYVTGPKIGKSYAKHFTKAPDVKDIFANPLKYLEAVPVKERYNIYFSVADVKPGSKRHEGTQKYLPFDIDDVDDTEKEEVLQCALDTLNLEWEQVLSVDSGNGVQFHIELFEPIPKTSYSNGYFDENREYYLGLLETIDKALVKKGLSGKCDPSVFKSTQVMRFPETKNIKPDKPDKFSRSLNNICEPLKFDIKMHGKHSAPMNNPKVSNLHVNLGESIVKFPAPDTKAVLSECKFLVDVKENPQSITEPQWYGALSILARLDDGISLCHDLSRGHASYTYEETQSKIEQALARSGPLTCQKINTLSSKCQSCKHFNTHLISPISIKAPTTITTKSTGFRNCTMKNGKPVTGKPCYDDIIKHCDTDLGGYFSMEESSITYKYSKTHWKLWHKNSIEGVAEKIICPSPVSSEVKEVLNKIRRTNLRCQEDIIANTVGKINLANGVIEISSGKFHTHSRDFSFMYQLPYDYDEDAVCPMFDSFLDNITCKRTDLKIILLEFMAYALSNDPLWEHKALILLGGGSNGKSTFIRLLQNLAGKDNYSSISIKDLSNDQKLATLENKLFNIRAESGTTFYDCEEFKEITSGETITVKRLYAQPYQISPRCKIIVAANKMPKSYDDSEGFLRRLLIVPFNAKFTDETKDRGMDDKLLVERSGILNKIMNAYRDLHKRGKFIQSKLVDDEVEKYKAEIIPEIDFADECLELVGLEDHRVSNQALYATYNMYCRENNIKPKARIGFFGALKHAIPDIDDRRIRDKNGRYVLGIKILKDIRGYRSASGNMRGDIFD